MASGESKSVVLPFLTFVAGTLIGSAVSVVQYFDQRADKLEEERREVSRLLGEGLDKAKILGPRLDCYLSIDSRTTDIERNVADQLRSYVKRSGVIRNAPLTTSKLELLDKRMDVGIQQTWIDSADVILRDVAARMTASERGMAVGKCNG